MVRRVDNDALCHGCEVVKVKRRQLPRNACGQPQSPRHAGASAPPAVHAMNVAQREHAASRGSERRTRESAWGPAGVGLPHLCHSGRWRVAGLHAGCTKGRAIPTVRTSARTRAASASASRLRRASSSSCDTQRYRVQSVCCGPSLAALVGVVRKKEGTHNPSDSLREAGRGILPRTLPGRSPQAGQLHALRRCRTATTAIEARHRGRAAWGGLPGRTTGTCSCGK